MTFSLVDVLEEFVSTQYLGRDRSWALARPATLGLEALRRAWRERQRTRGLCVYCREPHVPEHDGYAYPLCARHLEVSQKRARPRSPESHQAWRRTQRERGLCVHCSKPHLASHTGRKAPLCARHEADARARTRAKRTQAQKARVRTWMESQRERGLCVRCMTPHLAAHAGRKTPLCAHHEADLRRRRQKHKLFDRKSLVDALTVNEGRERKNV